MGIQVLQAVVIVFTISGGSTLKATFRAAVYEHAVLLAPEWYKEVSRADALHLMMENLITYQQQVEIAAKQGAEIIVFPEDGIYSMVFKTRLAVRPYLEDIPDPKKETWRPCVDPFAHHPADVQTFLSCLAKNNSIYLVANMGDIKPCHSLNGTNCPSDGYYQYNTDVAFDPSGKLVARYHKKHLFDEFQFDEPATADMSYFDTPFGRFGMFTCFDILYKDPAVNLVEQLGIRNIAFPTAWMDALPLLASIQTHSAFAAAFDVNVLAANIHQPTSRFHGSGIYTPRGAQSFYWNSQTMEPRLLVSDIEILRSRPRRNNHRVEKQLSFSAGITNSNVNNSNVGSQSLKRPFPNEFTSEIWHDVYNLVPLYSTSGNLDVCQNNLCCHLDYKISNNSANEFYAYGAFDGLHTTHFTYYFQNCILLKCKSHDLKSCGRLAIPARTSFSHFSLSGNFSSITRVYPEIILSDGVDEKLAPIGKWNKLHGVEGSGIETPLISAALLGRAFEWDTTKINLVG